MRAGRSSYTGVGAVWNLQVSKLVLSWVLSKGYPSETTPTTKPRTITCSTLVRPNASSFKLATYSFWSPWNLMTPELPVMEVLGFIYNLLHSTPFFLPARECELIPCSDHCSCPQSS
jgi:hypothetical protein